MPLASVESEIMNLRCSSRIDIRHHGLDMGLNEARGSTRGVGSMSGSEIWGRTEMLACGDILMRASGDQPGHVVHKRAAMLTHWRGVPGGFTASLLVSTHRQQLAVASGRNP